VSGFDSPVKILMVLVIALVVLGPKRLPEVGRSLGQGIREFRDSMTGVLDHHDPPPATPSAQQQAPTQTPIHPTPPE
jgi:sec-independent protein translocase protein TatA